jgi:hypothetical protein
MVFHDHLFAVRASVHASMVPGPTAPGETEKAASALGELASVPVDLLQVGLERLQSAEH